MVKQITKERMEEIDLIVGILWKMGINGRLKEIEDTIKPVGYVQDAIKEARLGGKQKTLNRIKNLEDSKEKYFERLGNMSSWIHALEKVLTPKQYKVFMKAQLETADPFNEMNPVMRESLMNNNRMGGGRNVSWWGKWKWWIYAIGLGILTMLTLFNMIVRWLR